MRCVSPNLFCLKKFYRTAIEENNCWWFSATDIVRAINDEPDYTKAGNYWRWLKRKLKQEGIEPVSTTHDFKFEGPDGKMRIADVLDSEGVNLSQISKFAI